MNFIEKQNLIQGQKHVRFAYQDAQPQNNCTSNVSIEQPQLHNIILRQNEPSNNQRRQRRASTCLKPPPNRLNYDNKNNYLSKHNLQDQNVSKRSIFKSNTSIKFFNRVKKCVSYSYIGNSLNQLNKDNIFESAYLFIKKLTQNQRFLQQIIKQMDFCQKNQQVADDEIINIFGKQTDQIFQSQNLDLPKNQNIPLSKSVSIQLINNNDSGQYKSLSANQVNDQNSGGNFPRKNILTQIEQLVQSENMIMSYQKIQSKYSYCDNRLQSEQQIRNKRFNQDKNFKQVSLIISEKQQKQCSFFQLKHEILKKKNSSVSLKLCSQMGGSSSWFSSYTGSGQFKYDDILQKVETIQFDKDFIQRIFDNGDDQPQPFLINLSLCLLVKYFSHQKLRVSLNSTNILLLLSLSTLVSYKIYYDLPIAGLLDYIRSIIYLTIDQIKFCERKFVSMMDYQLNITNQQFYKIFTHTFGENK